jgi:hypothetical protein
MVVLFDKGTSANLDVYEIKMDLNMLTGIHHMSNISF